MRRIICVLTSRVPVCARGLGDGSDALANIPPPHTDASDSSALELLSETAKKRLDQAIKEAGKAPSSQERLQSLTDHRIVGEVRGRGMFAAVELVRDKSSRERLAPGSESAVYCRDTVNNDGLMVRQTGDAMIMAPPLICNKAEIDTLVDILAAGLDKTADHYRV